MFSTIRPNTHIALRLPSGMLKVVEIQPNTNINIGKFGTFPSNLLIGRPYYLTFELLDKSDGKPATELRVVPAPELHAEALGNDYAAPAESGEEPVGGEGSYEATDGGNEFDIVGEDGAVIMRSNRMTVDDPTRQKLTMEEIEELKKAGTGSGKEIIAKIMASHMAIDEKTSFSLAKYTLRKARKYLKRFTVFPVDPDMLGQYITEREAYKVLELREEGLGLIGSWANMHCGDASRVMTADDGISQIGGGRWLVVDDTAGLVTAALAEKMGILYPNEEEDNSDDEAGEDEDIMVLDNPTDLAAPETPLEPTSTEQPSTPNATTPQAPPTPRKSPREHIPQMSAVTNTLTVLHANNQPNLANLKYFSFDTGTPDPNHPLYKHLKSVSWLQLLHPHDDPTYAEPELIPDDTLAGFKSSKRGTYYKKRRRWERTSRVVDETRRGGYDGLVIASAMEPKTIMKELVPLVRGGGRVVVYSPNVEPLVELCDCYSKERRTAYASRRHEVALNGVKIKKEDEDEDGDGDADVDGEDEDEGDEDEDFPVDPTLLLAPSLQTSRARHWQVLPGRTHPMMTSKGGAEGYLFTATRVIPAEGKVEARGNFRGKKRKTGTDSAVPA